MAESLIELGSSMRGSGFLTDETKKKIIVRVCTVGKGGVYEPAQKSKDDGWRPKKT